LKKKNKKKPGAKKEDKSEPATAESSKVEDKVEHTPTPSSEVTNTEETKLAEEDGSKDGAEETVSELNTSSHQRKQSLSLQSKMRSSSFRQGSTGGPLSPNYAFSPEGDTGPDIYRKQAIRIDELEKENKRLAKEASDGEKRWKKAEEELEDLREADDDSTPNKDSSSNFGTSQEVEKLVCSRDNEPSW